MSDWEIVNENVPTEQEWSIGKELPQQKGGNGVVENYLKPLAKYEAGLGLGVGEGLINALSSMANIAPEAFEKLTGKKVPRFGKVDLMQYAPDGRASELGGTIGGIIGGFGAPVGGFTKAAQSIKFLPKFLKPIAAGAAAGASVSEGDRLKGAIIGGTLGTGVPLAKGTAKAASKVSEYISGPKKTVLEKEKAVKAIQEALTQAKGDVDLAKRDLAKNINQKIMANKRDISKSASTLEDLLPNKSTSKANEDLSNAFKSQADKIHSDFKNRYSDFNTKSGTKSVSVPFEKENIEALLKHGSKTTKEMGDKIAGKTIELDIANPITGKAVEVKVPPEKASVSDYIEFMREARDAAHYSRQASKGQVTAGERNDLLQKANALSELSKNAESKIKESVSPKEWSEFKRIQQDYANIMPSLREDKVFHNLWKKEKVTGMPIDQLNQPRNKELKTQLLKSKELKDALVNHKLSGQNHPVSGKDASQHERSIKSLFNEDKNLINMLDSKTVNQLKKHSDLVSKSETLNKTLGKVNTNELNRIIRDADIQFMKQYSPKVKSLLEAIDQGQKKEKELNILAKKANISLNEAKELAKKRKETIKDALKTSTIIGTLIGAESIFSKK